MIASVLASAFSSASAYSQVCFFEHTRSTALLAAWAKKSTETMNHHAWQLQVPARSLIGLVFKTCILADAEPGKAAVPTL